MVRLSPALACLYHGLDCKKGIYHQPKLETIIHQIQGSTVEENKPVRIDYYRTKLITDGRPGSIDTNIYVCTDSNNEGAPVYLNGDVERLATCTADLSLIPLAKFPIVVGADTKRYYKIVFDIEVTYFSAYTKYELIYQGKNYGAISVEYV